MVERAPGIFQSQPWYFQQNSSVSCVLLMVDNLEVIFEVRTCAFIQTFSHCYVCKAIDLILSEGDFIVFDISVDLIISVARVCS